MKIGMRIKNLMAVVFIATLSGCASMPSASVNYYLPKSSAVVTVIQTISCIDTSNPIVLTNVDIQTVYSANQEKTKPIKLSDLDTFYSNGNAEITLTEDGRLEAFNSNSTGVGSDVIAIFVSAIKTFEQKAVPVNAAAACAEINRVAVKNEKTGMPLPLSITLKSNVRFNNDSKYETTPFRITQYPQSFYDSVVPALGSLVYEIEKYKTLPDPVKATIKDGPKITLLSPAVVPIKVKLISSVSDETTEFSASVPVPQWGTEYDIPIPKPPMFGTNNLNLSLLASGKIKTLKYGATNGAKDLGSAFSTLSNKFAQTDSDKAAALKAEADVIAQQQRLIKCTATPTDCK